MKQFKQSFFPQHVSLQDMCQIIFYIILFFISLFARFGVVDIIIYTRIQMYIILRR